jgi:DNA-binding transcriptional MerR regulator
MPEHRTGDNMVQLPEGRAPRRHTRLLDQVERRRRIITLRKRGMTYEQIADVLAEGRDGGEPIKVTWNHVAHLVKRYLNNVDREGTESIEELRVLENERLDELLATWGPRARDGDARAANVVLRLMERRAKMNGLDAAQRIEHSHSGSVLHELGADPDEVKRQREAFQTAFADQGLDDVVDAACREVDDRGG